MNAFRFAPLPLTLLFVGACTAMRDGSDRAPLPEPSSPSAPSARPAPPLPVATFAGPSIGARPTCEGAACGSDGGASASSPPPRCARKRAHVAGDIDGDGRGDIALTGGFVPGSNGPWNTIPVAFSVGDGRFAVTNQVANDFAHYATQGALPVAGDIDGDGRLDLVLTGGKWWRTVPVAVSCPSSLGDGTFAVANPPQPEFAARAAEPGAAPLAGDFDGDGRADLALVGGSGAVDIPLALSNGDGTFRMVSHDAPELTKAAANGARAVSGDFDGDGKGDLALVGGAAPDRLTIAYGLGDGTFRTVTVPLLGLDSLAGDSSGLVVAGDFDADGRDDLAFAGGTGWTTVGVVFSRGTGAFALTAAGAPPFAALAQVASQLVATDADGDGCTDLALAGGIDPVSGAPWTTVPVAFSNADGSFRLVNEEVKDFPAYATQTGAKALGASQARR